MIRRLAFCEAVGAVALAAATAPFALPWAGAPPTWAQLLGLAFLLGMLATNLIILRRISTAVTLARLSEVLRLRLAVGVYVAAVLLLVPLPPSWGWFWFVLTVLGALLGCTALARMTCAEPFR